jgi:predicted dehydrogenase
MSPSTPPPVPSALRPIYLIGAGSIVRDAHLPAYMNVGYRVAGVFDLDGARAAEIAARAGARAFGSLAALVDAASADGGVFDVALPPGAVPATLAALPEQSTVLLQKPFGRDLAEATALLELTRARRLRGAVNFQLRYAPAVEAARALLAYGAIGELLDLELRVVCRMPWETWPFLEGMPRMEVLMHSIHYLDLARSFLGEPERVWCGTARHPSAAALTETRSTSVLGFGEMRRAVVTTYHHHAAPEGHDASHLRLEGTRGTMVARLGVNLDYPRGRADTLELSRDGGAWERVPLRGHWFPHGFEGPMRALQRLAAGDVTRIHSEFDDAWRTMALVETCYKSAAGGERVPGLPPDAAQGAPRTP